MLRVGYGEGRIATAPDLELSGYGYYLQRRVEKPLDDIKVRCIALTDGETDLLLISCDLLGLALTYSDRVRGEISERFGMPAHNILLACTHTHTAPASQPLEGLGEISASFLPALSELIMESVAAALDDSADAQAEYLEQTIEPIGFNRVQRAFEPIDASLRTFIFRRRIDKIYLFNYACHPVVLGPAKAASADWPGSVIAMLEERGDRALFLQGFCGDIDPVTNRDRWGRGDARDLEIYGRLLSSRIFKAEEEAARIDNSLLMAREIRVDLPLQIPRREEIAMQVAERLAMGKADETGSRFCREWACRAEEWHDRLAVDPWMRGVPVQSMAIGCQRMLALPGEVFCSYGLKIKADIPHLMTIGYAGGNIGYLPTAEAFADKHNYACYTAPMFYAVYPFRQDIEAILLSSARQALAELRI